MHVNRSLLGWGAFFILVGAIPLAAQAGLLTAAQVSDWWRFWPLILIGIGLGLLLRRTPLEALGGLVIASSFGIMVGAALSGGVGGLGGVSSGVCGPLADATPFSATSGQFGGTSASVQIDLDCGDVTVSTASGAGWRVEGEDDTGAGPAVDSGPAALAVSSSDDDRGPFDWLGNRERWAIGLPTGPRLDLEAEVNAGAASFDLAGADIDGLDLEMNAGAATIDLLETRHVDDLQIEMNAGSLGLLLPASGTSGAITANAGSIRLCAPPGVALRLRTADSALASFDYDGHGLIHVGDTWQSPDFDTAAVRIDLRTEGNAASFTLDPEDGCDD